MPGPDTVPAATRLTGELARRDWYRLEERHAGVMRARLATLAVVTALALALGDALGGAPAAVTLASGLTALVQVLLWRIPGRSPRRLRIAVDVSVAVDVVWAAAVIHNAGGVESRAAWLLLLAGLWSALGYSARTGVKSATLASLAYLWLVWVGADRLLTPEAVGNLALMWGLLAVAVAGAAAGEAELRRRAERLEVLHDLAQRLLRIGDAAAVREAAAAAAARLMPGWTPRWAEEVPDPGGDDRRPRLRRTDDRLEVMVAIPGPSGGDQGWVVLERPRGRARTGRIRVREIVALETLAAGVGNALWRIRLTRDLHRHTVTDQLTGLTNRRGYDAVLGRLLAGLTRTPDWVSLCLVDVDRFKVYNDTHGHQAGDEALRAVARALSRSVRPGDVAARYGGEEMALVLPGASPEDALRVAERARRAVEAMDLAPSRVTVSVGVASTRLPCTPEVLAEAADRCLYAAKHAGRNRVVTHAALGGEADPAGRAVS